jgi:hypothetical protein
MDKKYKALVDKLNFIRQVKCDGYAIVKINHFFIVNILENVANQG